MKSETWRGVRLRLREQEGREFEREIERLLRFRFPNIIQTPARQRLDRAGIDLVARGPEHRIEVAVQCKGYQVSLPAANQIQQALDSIRSFKDSNETARTFIFVHNRDGRARELKAAIEPLLAELIRLGKCTETEFHDLDDILNDCKRYLQAFIISELKEAATRKLQELRDLFDVGGPPQLVVPATEFELRLNATSTSENLAGRLVQVSPVGKRNVQELLVSRSDARFTLLTGIFGTGKSTAGLLAASSRHTSSIIFAECSHFATDRLGSGLSVLLEEILKSAGVFANIEEWDDELVRLAVPLLRENLGNRGNKLGRENEFVLIVDGLDENRLYSRPDGMAVLMNSLGDLHCPIVLTTRKEQFVSTFESVESGLLILGRKHGWKRPIRVFSLEPWDRAQVCEFVEGSMRALQSVGRSEDAERIRTLLQLLDQKKESDFYGSLSTHPLFLRLILDDVAANGIRKMGRALLLLEWSRFKIRRDIERKAVTQNQGWKFEPDFISRSMMFMEQVAWSMTADNGESLVEEIDKFRFEALAHTCFQAEEHAALTAILNSLLVPRQMYETGAYSIHFVYRIFHEFFLACFAARNGLAIAPKEKQVPSLISELKQLNLLSSAAAASVVF